MTERTPCNAMDDGEPCPNDGTELIVSHNQHMYHLCRKHYGTLPPEYDILRRKSEPSRG